MTLGWRVDTVLKQDSEGALLASPAEIASDAWDEQGIEMKPLPGN